MPSFTKSVFFTAQLYVLSRPCIDALQVYALKVESMRSQGPAMNFASLHFMRVKLG